MKTSGLHYQAGPDDQQHRVAAGRRCTPLSLERSVCFLLGWLTVLLGSGCQTVHTVTVDAISNPSKPLGESYRLEVIDPSGGVDEELQAEAAATIRDTLAARGLYEAPLSVIPDMIIKFEYGVGPGHIKIVTQRNTDLLLGPYAEPVTNSKAVVVHDKYIELTAREPGRETGPDPARPRGVPGKPGEELWNIRATIEDPQKDLGPFLPALASACIDYIGGNTGRELQFKVEAEKAKALLRQRPPPPAPTPAK